MTHDPKRRIVLLDASVLVNLLHAGLLAFLAQVAGIQFVVPDHVLDEVLAAPQRAELEAAIQAGTLRTAPVADQASLAAFLELTGVRLGQGEAACIALAIGTTHFVACDDRKARVVAAGRLGPGRLLTTPGVMVLLIRAGALTVEAADAARARLESEHRFKMTGFESFAELIGKRA